MNGKIVNLFLNIFALSNINTNGLKLMLLNTNLRRIGEDLTYGYHVLLIRFKVCAMNIVTKTRKPNKKTEYRVGSTILVNIFIIRIFHYRFYYISEYNLWFTRRQCVLSPKNIWEYPSKNFCCFCFFLYAPPPRSLLFRQVPSNS